MSERLHELHRLAGLDAMLFHFNFDTPTFSPCTNGAVDVMPILNIPAGDKRDFAERTARSPLSPKARDMNTDIPNTPFSPKRKGFVQRNTPSEAKHVEPASPSHVIAPAVPSFTSLPHVPSTSSLLLPTFLELSLHLDHLSLQLQRGTSPNDAARKEDAIRQTNPRNLLPAFSHPNSPYVPWASSDREEVLQPLPTTPSSPSSGFLSAYSRPYSRSGARAPEPTHCPEADIHRVNFVRRSWINARQVVKRSVRRVVKRIGCFSHFRRASTPQPSLEPEWEQVSPPIPGSRSTSPRRSSVASVETNSLATWLAERRRQSLEHDGLQERRMTVAEYERMGSWIHDSGDDSSECSVDEIPITIYDAFSPGLTTFGGNITASDDGRASVLWTLQQLDELGLIDDVPYGPSKSPIQGAQRQEHLENERFQHGCLKYRLRFVFPRAPPASAMPRFQLFPYYLQDALAHFLLPFLMPAPEHCIDAAASDSTSQILPGPSCSAAAPSPSSRSHSPPGGYRTTCVDRSSTFFRSLTAPLASSQHSEPWHEPFLDPSSDYSPDSTRVDLPWSEERDPSVTAGDEREPVAAAGPDLPRGYWPSILPKNIYTPHGKWAWAGGKPIDDPKEEAFLSRYSSAYSLSINSGSLDGRSIRYVCKSWAGSQINDKGFFTELALYKCQLKPLQGSVVPSIIGVHSSATSIDVALEPPHPSFWMEASSDMPHVLKQRCIAAIQQVHDQGVLHGDIQLRHMLLGGNAKVSIVDFDGGRAILPGEKLKVGKASAEDLDEEMKRVKALLKYSDAPDKESTAVFDVPAHGGPVSRRFVMPGQTPAQLQDAIQRFLSLVDGLTDARPPSDEPTESRLPPDTDEPKSDTVPHPPPALRERSPEPPPPLQPYQDHVSQEERGIRTYHLRKRKGAPIAAASPAPKRSRRGVSPYSKSGSGVSRKECKAPSARASSSKLSTPGRRHHPALFIPERLLSLDPLTPSPATPSPDPLLLTAPPLSSQPVASSSRPLSPSPPLQSTVLPWSGDPYGQSRGHDNYAKLVALAGQRNIPKFKPGSASHQNRPSLPQLILDSHDDVVDSGVHLITQSAVAIGKRKRDEVLDCPNSEDTTRRAHKVLKWSEAPETNNPSPSKPRRIRSILKKHNPPAIRSIEMSRIAELTDDEDEDIVIQCGVVTVEDVDRINDGSKDLEEELDDDLDMLIDALDSDDNFLSGYPSANLQSHELDIGPSSSGEIVEPSAVASTVITKIPPIPVRDDESTETLLPDLCQGQGKEDLGAAIDLNEYSKEGPVGDEPSGALARLNAGDSAIAQSVVHGQAGG